MICESFTNFSIAQSLVVVEQHDLLFSWFELFDPLIHEPIRSLISQSGRVVHYVSSNIIR